MKKMVVVLAMCFLLVPCCAMAENLRIDLANYWLEYSGSEEDNSGNSIIIRAEILHEILNTGFTGGIGARCAEYQDDVVDFDYVLFVGKNNFYLAGKYKFLENSDYAGAELWYRGWLNPQVIYIDAVAGFSSLMREQPTHHPIVVNPENIFYLNAEVRYYYKKLFAGAEAGWIIKQYNQYGVNDTQTIPVGVMAGYGLTKNVSLLGGYIRHIKRMNFEDDTTIQPPNDINIYYVKIEIRL